MKIKFKLFASLSKHLPEGSVGNSTYIEILANTSIHDVLVHYEIPKDTVHLVLLNGIYIEPEERETPILPIGKAVKAVLSRVQYHPV